MVSTIRKITFLLFITLGLLALTVTAGDEKLNDPADIEDDWSFADDYEDSYEDIDYSGFPYSDENYNDYEEDSYEEIEDDIDY